jgi:Icc-related predicted phosphoesterase
MSNLKLKTMKARILIIAMALMGSSLLFAQQPVSHETKTDCEKKVLKKVERTMRLLNVKDILDEGQKSAVIVTCYINENNEVEVARIDGSNDELKEAVVETFEDHPVICKMGKDDNYFTFRIAFEHRPA